MTALLYCGQCHQRRCQIHFVPCISSGHQLLPLSSSSLLSSSSISTQNPIPAINVTTTLSQNIGPSVTTNANPSLSNDVVNFCFPSVPPSSVSFDDSDKIHVLIGYALLHYILPPINHFIKQEFESYMFKHLTPTKSIQISHIQALIAPHKKATFSFSFNHIPYYQQNCNNMNIQKLQVDTIREILRGPSINANQRWYYLALLFASSTTHVDAKQSQFDVSDTMSIMTSCVLFHPLNERITSSKSNKSSVPVSTNNNAFPSAYADFYVNGHHKDLFQTIRQIRNEWGHRRVTATPYYNQAYYENSIRNFCALLTRCSITVDIGLQQLDTDIKRGSFQLNNISCIMRSDSFSHQHLFLLSFSLIENLINVWNIRIVDVETLKSATNCLITMALSYSKSNALISQTILDSFRPMMSYIENILSDQQQIMQALERIRSLLEENVKLTHSSSKQPTEENAFTPPPLLSRLDQFYDNNTTSKLLFVNTLLDKGLDDVAHNCGIIFRFTRTFPFNNFFPFVFVLLGESKLFS